MRCETIAGSSANAQYVPNNSSLFRKYKHIREIYENLPHFCKLVNYFSQFSDYFHTSQIILTQILFKKLLDDLSDATPPQVAD